jgi:hypothetical protein
MTGSGKTGLLTVVVEEALRAKVPVLVVDVKGDLPNLLLAFPSFDSSMFLPWVSSGLAPGDDREPLEVAQQLAEQRRNGLVAWGLGEAEILKRTLDIDPAHCSRCAGRQPIAIITRDDGVDRIWSHLNLPTSPEPRDVDAPQRSPRNDQGAAPPAPDC